MARQSRARGSEGPPPLPQGEAHLPPQSWTGPGWGSLDAHTCLETEGGLTHLSLTWAGSCSPLTASRWSLILTGSGQLVGTKAEKTLFVPRGKRPPVFLLLSCGLRQDPGGKSWEVFCWHRLTAASPWSHR